MQAKKPKALSGGANKKTRRLYKSTKAAAARRRRPNQERLFLSKVNKFSLKVKAFADNANSLIDKAHEGDGLRQTKVEQMKTKIKRFKQRTGTLGREGRFFDSSFNIQNAVPEDVPLKWILESPLSNGAYQLHKCLREMQQLSSRLREL